MKRLVLSTFACDPKEGSEMGNGWNWATKLINEGFEVHCFTRITGKKNIEEAEKYDNLIFHFIALPFGLEKLYFFSTPTMYLYYVLWQWAAYRSAKKLHKKKKFSMAHHVTWGSTQMGSFMYKLKIPFVFGPAGGGQIVPIAFRSYFLNNWAMEEKREKISRLLLKYNPACKKMLQKSHVVLCSNPDTEKMARSVGAKNVVTSLDGALPESFFPKKTIVKQGEPGKLKLLWIGRFMPRKGLLLVLDVMKQLEAYPGITLTVVGDGEMKDRFLQQIKEDQLENTVDWKGTVPYESVKGFYASHDVFFFTSLRDSGPTQLIEAMAYSMPVVTINLHGQSVIVNDERGIRCNCSTPEIAVVALKEAILMLYNNPALVAQKGKAAYEFALQQTWDRKIHSIVKNHYPVFI